MSRFISRETFLKGCVGAAVAAAATKVFMDANSSIPYTCTMLGPSMNLGHKIRNGEIALDGDIKSGEPKKVVIVGGGIAGLSAGWWLNRSGFSDFVLLELEEETGGNSRSGKNNVSAYPWGAHYIPLANPESEYVRMFFEESGIIEGFDDKGTARYNELYLCHEPEDRLFKDGIFTEGLVPKRGLQPDERAELERFFDLIDDMRAAEGADGKPAFAIPIEQSSQDPKWLKLDRISMTDWLKQQNLRSVPLAWYVNYCCRDDYGSTSDNVSAWAGIHYFAGRRGTASNAEMNWVVTWPEGNAFAANKLREKFADNIRANCPVVSVKSTGGKLNTIFAGKNGLEAIESEFVVFAAPRFLAPHIIAGYPDAARDRQSMSYAPWMVANITLNKIPGGKGADLAWDNVSYRSPSLGYVVATHQNITTQRRGPLVLTYYHPQSSQDPRTARRALLSKSAGDWGKEIVSDLEKMHPGIREEILSIDLWPWGHGMISPSPDYIWGDFRKSLLKNHGNIYFAHSDMSGISNFEEAQYRGVQAAKAILAKLPQS